VSLVIDGGVGSLEAAAVLAAIARFEEELLAVRSVPPPRPVQSRWVMSGRPQRVESPFATSNRPLQDGSVPSARPTP
jgi:hypothetical protein